MAEEKESRCTDTADLLEKMGIKQDTIDSIDEELGGYCISQNLVVARARANLTQQELADKIEKPVGFVEDLESTPDVDMRIGDLKAYAKGLGFDGVEVTFFHKGLRYGC